MSTNPSGPLPPIGGGASRPAGLKPLGGSSAPSKPDLGSIHIDNLESASPPHSAVPASTAEAPAAPILRTDERQYKRQPSVTGQGAIRCKTFHVKLNDAALTYMDDTVNAWLEQHGYEAKFTHMTIGVFQGKTMEQHLIVQVWY